jgi:beta propeller repeat protein
VLLIVEDEFLSFLRRCIMGTLKGMFSIKGIVILGLITAIAMVWTPVKAQEQERYFATWWARGNGSITSECGEDFAIQSKGGNWEGSALIGVDGRVIYGSETMSYRAYWEDNYSGYINFSETTYDLLEPALAKPGHYWGPLHELERDGTLYIWDPVFYARGGSWSPIVESCTRWPDGENCQTAVNFDVFNNIFGPHAFYNEDLEVDPSNDMFFFKIDSLGETDSLLISGTSPECPDVSGTVEYLWDVTVETLGLDVDWDGDGFSPDDGDCNDGDPAINPDSHEICDDGIDNDCDMFADSTDLDCIPAGGEQAIITDLENQNSPAVYGDKIVWVDWRNENSDIYMYDLSNPVAGGEAICTNPSAQYMPAIYGDKIVWHDFRNGNDDIFMYDLSNPVPNGVPITTDPSDQRFPAIYGDKIVWEDNRSGNWDIYMYDLSNPVLNGVPICTNSAEQHRPAIYEDEKVIIVWDDKRNGNYDIYMYDLSNPLPNGVPITDDPAHQQEPAIYGNKVVWHDFNGNADIYMYDLSNPVLNGIRITDDPAMQLHPVINGDKIVWEDHRNGNGDIYMYDLSNPVLNGVPICTNHYQQLYPAIHGDKVVWNDYRWGSPDIYMYVITQVSNVTPIGTQVAVQPPDYSAGGAPVTLTFDEVTQEGTTSLTVTTTGPEPPSGFYLGTPPVYYELSTTALFSGSIEVCINYSGISFDNEDSLELYHWPDDVPVTTYRDPVNNIICGVVSSLSPFAILEPSELAVCQELIESIKEDLADVAISGKNSEKVRGALERKLDSAKDKLGEEKFEDALQKLSDFRTEVLKLADEKKPKISQEDADLLVASVDEAIACIEELSGGP